MISFRRTEEDIHQSTSSVKDRSCTDDTRSCCVSSKESPPNTFRMNKLSGAIFSGGIYQGFLYALLSTFFAALSSVCVKKLEYIGPLELVSVRNAGVLVGNIPFLVSAGTHPLGPKPRRFLLVICSSLGVTGLCFSFLGLQLLPLTESTIIQSTVPAVAMVMAKIFVKESCGLLPSIAVLITLAGVCLSVSSPEPDIKRSQSSFTTQYMLGIVFGLGSVLLISSVFVIQRKLKDVYFFIVSVYTGFVGFVVSVTITFCFIGYISPCCGVDRLWFLLVGVNGFVGQGFMVLAIQTEAIAIVSVLMGSTQIVLAMVMQIIFFESVPSTFNISGAIIVIFSISVIGIRKWLQGKSCNSIMRKKLRFFLL